MADSLHELIKGLKTLWDAESSLSTINGPYRHQKPPNLSIGFPYVVVDDQGSDLLGYTCQSQIWIHRIIFRVFHRTPELAAASLALIRAVFDSDSLSLTLASGHSFISCRPTTIAYEDKDKEVESAETAYEFQMNQTRVA